MEMTRLEKFFVNRERKGLGNVQRVRRAIEGRGAGPMREAEKRVAAVYGGPGYEGE